MSKALSTILSPPQLDAMRRGELKLIVTPLVVKRLLVEVDGELIDRDIDGIYPDDLLECPFGRVGGEIWVKESYWQSGTWSERRNADDTIDRLFYGPTPFNTDGVQVLSADECRRFDDPGDKNAWLKRPARTMPQWASRHSLRLLSVEVRKVNTITAAEALAAGVECRDGGDETWFYAGKHRAGSARGAFQADYESKGGSFDDDFAWFARVELIDTTQPHPASAAGEGGEK